MSLQGPDGATRTPPAPGPAVHFHPAHASPREWGEGSGQTKGGFNLPLSQLQQLKDAGVGNHELGIKFAWDLQLLNSSRKQEVLTTACIYTLLYIKIYIYLYSGGSHKESLQIHAPILPLC